MTLDKFYEIFADAKREYPFEQVRWPFPSTEDRRPPLFAQFHSLPTGQREDAEFPFSPVSAVWRMIWPDREVGWVNAKEWSQKLHLPLDDVLDLLHAQEGVLDTPRRREIRDRLEEIIGTPVSCFRKGVPTEILYRPEPPEKIDIAQFLERFKACAGEYEWMRPPWPSKHHPEPRTCILSATRNDNCYREDPLTFTARHELDEEALLELESMPPLEWALAMGLPYWQSWALVNAIRGHLFPRKLYDVRDRLDLTPLEIRKKIEEIIDPPSPPSRRSVMTREEFYESFTELVTDHPCHLVGPLGSGGVDSIEFTILGQEMSPVVAVAARHHFDKVGEIPLRDQDAWAALLGLDRTFLWQLYDATNGPEFGSEDWEEGTEPWMEVRRRLFDCAEKAGKGF